MLVVVVIRVIVEPIGGDLLLLPVGGLVGVLVGRLIRYWLVSWLVSESAGGQVDWRSSLVSSGFDASMLVSSQQP